MATQNKYLINADLKLENYIQVPRVTKNDDVVFVLTITDDNRPVSLDGIDKFVLGSIRPDRKPIPTIGEKTGDNEVTFKLESSAISIIGRVRASVQMFFTDGRISTLPFSFEVIEDSLSGFIPDESETSLIQLVLGDAPFIIEAAQSATIGAEDAAAQTLEALDNFDTEKSVAIQELDDVKEENKTNWKQEVATVALRDSTYPNPQTGDTVRITGEARIDRFNGTEWVTTDRYNPAVVDELTGKLAETGKLPAPMTSLRNQGKTTGACITFTDDDATAQVWTKLKDWAAANDVPYVIAVPPKAQASFPTMISFEQMRILQNEYNFEIASHSLTHPSFQQISEEQILYEITESKRILTQEGLKVKNIIYPFGSGFEPHVQRISTQYYNCGVAASGNVNVKPVKSMDLGRIALGSFYEGANDGSLEYLKSKVDEAIAKNGWVIFMTHVWNSAHTEQQWQNMTDLVAYARSKGVDIVNLQDGYERFGNVVEVPGKLVIQNDGEIVKDNFNNVSVASSSGVTPTTPITSFLKNKITINHFNLSSNSGFPHSNAGTLETYHINDYSNSYQVWRPFIDVGASNIPTFYYRRAMTATTWGPFKRVAVGEKMAVSATIGTIAAGKVVVADIAVTNVSNTDTITISPGFGLPAELIYSVKRVNSTLLRLAVFNPTTIDFTISSTTWNLAITN